MAQFLSNLMCFDLKDSIFKYIIVVLERRV
jgi:hypothetical protein